VGRSKAIAALRMLSRGRKRCFAKHALRRCSRYGLQAIPWIRPASASPLQGAFPLASGNRTAGGQHVARIPCFTLALASDRRGINRKSGCDRPLGHDYGAEKAGHDPGVPRIDAEYKILMERVLPIAERYELWQ
ncbi:MAG TPA: hypothetical protein VEC06_04715, partial [Paucimonas sp.]|nr:hypothetical protein [Paucimonas sp.]